MDRYSTLRETWRRKVTAALLASFATIVSACDLSIVDNVPATPRDRVPNLRVVSAPESIPIAEQCGQLGLELGTPDMDIGAGRADITLPARTNQVEILVAPATLDQSDTEYILMQDVSAPGTAFEVTRSDITFNLNGHTVTYGTNDSPDVPFPNGTAGIKVAWGQTDVVVANGTIAQGSGACQGDVSGRNCNPVMAQGGSGSVEIGGLMLSYHTPDTSGIVAPVDGEIHHNTLIDSGNYLTYAGTGVPAIRAQANEIHHNLILSARHRGIVPGNNSEVSYNEIHINSYQSNSYGIMAFEIQGFTFHHNKIYGDGVHPIGIGPVGTGGTNGQIYSNFIETENSRTVAGTANGSSAFRITTYGGWCDSIEVMCNYFVSKGGNAHRELDGKSWGRTLWIGGFAQGNTADIHHNYIQALTNDSSKYHSAVAVVSGGYNDGLFIEDNVIVANHTVVALADGYGASGLGYARFARNNFIRKDNYTTYRTVADKLNEYWDVTAMFMDNVYSNGADISSATTEILYYCTSNKTELIFGHFSGSQPVVEYYLTDDPARVAAGSASEPFGACGFKVIP